MILKVVDWVFRHLRKIIGAFLLLAAVYLLASVMGWRGRVSRLESWLSDNGDAEIQKYYAEAKGMGKGPEFGIACRTYEKRYGQGIWISKFKADNVYERNARITYADLAALVLNISDEKMRNEFLDAHAAVYDAFVMEKALDEARHYADVLAELQRNGGKYWRVASRNVFAVCVFDKLRDCAELLDWYFDNAEWCDPFLCTLNCLDEKDEGLDEAIALLKKFPEVYKALNDEIASLDEHELQGLANDSNHADARSCAYEAGFTFISMYGETLKELLAGGVPVIESMAVIANNCDAFEWNSLNDFREAGVKLQKVHDQHRIVWRHACNDGEAGVIKFLYDVPQWAEQIVGMFGELNVVDFLRKYYNDNPRVLSVACEILYKCEEPGWAVLNKYRDNSQFKELMCRDKVGFRIVPYYLKYGEQKMFAELWDDARWMDEYFDQNGNMKSQAVSLIEMSPVGGDVATVVKKWAQGRPTTAGEIGWAAFDAADTVVMAFTLGMSKVATTTAKTGIKTGTKYVGRKAAKQLAEKQSRRITTHVLKARRFNKELINVQIRQSGKAAIIDSSRKGLPVLKRFSSTLRSAGRAFGTGTAEFKNLVGKGFRGVRNVSPSAWRNAYRTSKAFMWLGFAHRVVDKGPDFVETNEKELGAWLGRMVHAVAKGAGEGMKEAVRECLGVEGGGEGLARSAVRILSCAMVLGLALWLLLGGRR